jgi:hypothetical protein
MSLSFIEIILVILPVPLEIYYDINRWNDGKSDKPISTILRGIAFLLIGMINDWVLHNNTWWQTAILCIGVHFMLFDYSLNLIRHKPIFHHSGKGFDRIWNVIPNFFNPIVRAIVLYTTYIIFSRIDLIS